MASDQAVQEPNIPARGMVRKLWWQGSDPARAKYTNPGNRCVAIMASDQALQEPNIPAGALSWVAILASDQALQGPNISVRRIVLGSHTGKWTSPARAKYTSPGHRPGYLDCQRFKALQGRHFFSKGHICKLHSKIHKTLYSITLHMWQPYC